MLNLQQNILLAPYTSFQIGGPADYFTEANSPEELIEAIQHAQQKQLPFFILGGGSNTLFHENGFRGIVIKSNFKKITVHDNHNITAEAGALLSALLQKSESFPEWIGLPGTVGGAIRGNAGANGLEVKDVLKTARIYNFETGEIKEFTNAQLEFDYRHSLLKKNKNLLVLSGTFEIPHAPDPTTDQANDRQRNLQKMTDILKKRNATQPKGKSAGCVFKNPAPGISAGKLIDEAGCKGLHIGDIEISTTHGNFFLNHGKGTQREVIELIEMAKQKVLEKHKIQLQEEVEIVPER